MRWRIGNAYYSFLREAYVMAELRSRRLDVRSHPLADALFHVDCWVGDVNIELCIGNRQFRAGGLGRKTASSELLSDAEPRFRTLQIELPVGREFGRVHFPDNLTLNQVAERLRSAGTDRCYLQLHPKSQPPRYLPPAAVTVTHRHAPSQELSPNCSVVDGELFSDLC